MKQVVNGNRKIVAHPHSMRLLYKLMRWKAFIVQPSGVRANGVCMCVWVSVWVTHPHLRVYYYYCTRFKQCGKCAIHMFQVHSTLTLRRINKRHQFKCGGSRILYDTVATKHVDFVYICKVFSCRHRCRRRSSTFIQLFVSIVAYTP